MSYILDALRKADAERERGSVPGLHAQPSSAMAATSVSARPATRWLIGGAAMVAVLLGALTTTVWLMRPPVPTAAATAPVTAQSPGDVVARTATAQPPLVAPTLPAPELAPGPARMAQSAVSRKVAPVATVPSKLPMPTVALVAPARVDVGSGSALPARAADSPSAAAASATMRIPEWRELPETLRRDLPGLAIGGASYSENAASRMLIINGQVFHENDAVGPDHVLEQIRLRSAVLRFKGFRYSVAY